MTETLARRAWFWLLLLTIILLIIYCILLALDQYNDWSWVFLVLAVLLFVAALIFYFVPTDRTDTLTPSLQATQVVTPTNCPTVSTVTSADQLI